MQYRTLGRSGYKISEIGLGCWQLGGDFGPIENERAQAVLTEAAKQGINFWDTADVYGGGKSEQYIGDWQGTQPKELFVATKVGRDGALYPDGYTKDKVRRNIEGSLQRLKVDSLDLVQLHCIPPEVMQDGEVFTWLEDFQQDGLIRQFGTSVETIEEALLCIEQPKLTSVQIIFNLFRQDAIEALFPAAQKADVGIIVRLPLASGILSGKMSAQHQFAEQDHRNYNKDGEYFSVGETFSGIPFEKGLELVENLREYAGTDTQLSQFALRWILDQPAVSSVIAGASKPEQVISNAASSNLPKLSDTLHKQLADFYQQDVRQHIRCPV